MKRLYNLGNPGWNQPKEGTCVAVNSHLGLPVELVAAGSNNKSCPKLNYTTTKTGTINTSRRIHLFFLYSQSCQPGTDLLLLTVIVHIHSFEKPKKYTHLFPFVLSFPPFFYICNILRSCLRQLYGVVVHYLQPTYWESIHSLQQATL